MRALNASELTLRLLERGLLTTAEGVRVEDVSRRNRSVTLVGEPGRSFFVKQNVDGPAMLQREAAIYRRASGRTSLPFGAHLPRFRYATRRLLVLDLIDGAGTLTDRAAGGRVSASAAAGLGIALAKVHRSEAKGFARADRPWSLDLAAPPVEILRDASAANHEILRMLQESKRFCSALDELRRGWRSTALIHGDLRTDNVLLRPRQGRRGADIWIIDWEHSGIGEPAWDVASVIASFLFLWVLSLPFVPGAGLRALVRAAGTPADSLRRGIGAFWSAYASESSFGPHEAQTFLLRALRFAAARLVQHAWEQANGSLRVTGDIVCALQLSQNVMLAPEDARELLVGRRK